MTFFWGIELDKMDLDHWKFPDHRIDCELPVYMPTMIIWAFLTATAMNKNSDAVCRRCTSV